MIDINYSSREPQIVIHQKESDDPRDKLISMFIGEAMPGVRDGYCRIERYPGTEMIVITPLHPVDAIRHIPAIANYAEENASCDTSQVPGHPIIRSRRKRNRRRKVVAVMKVGSYYGSLIFLTIGGETRPN